MTTKYLWYLLYINLVLPFFVNQSFAQTPPKREFRGVWLTTVGNGDWPRSAGLPAQTQKDQLISYLDGLKAVGTNVVFLQVRPECDAFYQSSLEPWSYWLTGTQGAPPAPYYDPLQFAVEEAHKRGMELHAWFNPYRVIRSGSTYPKAANHVSRTHPEWVMAISGTSILDPGKAVVRTYVLNVISDVVRRYDIDGVVMDDYFYVEGITTQDATTFATEPRGFTNLGDWRRDNVNLLVRGIYDSVNALKPWVKFGMSPRGIWKNGVPSGIVGANNYSDIYCDAVAWLQGKYIDYFSPQLYWRFGPSQDYGLLEPWWASQLNGRIYCPSLAAYRIGETNFGNAGEIARQIRFNRSNKAHGQVPFTAHNLTDNLGGLGDTLRTDLYRYPALIPVIPWNDSVPPFPPRGIKYEPAIAGGPAVLRWEVPISAADGDSASWYAVYRFDHYPLRAEFDAPQNLVAVVDKKQFVPPTPTQGGTYYFAVTALDRNQNESDTSNVVRVAPPPVPVLAFPANNATSIPESVMVRWRVSPGASGFALQASVDSTFSSVSVANISSITDTAYVLRGYQGQKSVYWRVRGSNGAGASPFSAPFRFVSGIPTAVTLSSPANYAPDIPINTPLRWGSATAASAYRVQMAVNDAFAPTALDTSAIADTTLALNQLEYYRTYFWRVKASNTLGSTEWSSTFRFRTVQMTAVERGSELPTEFSLSQNYPNPFNPATTIQFAVPRQVRVSIKVYDILGREEATLVNEEMPAGTYTVRFDASRFASGMYFYRMTAGEFGVTKRLMVVK